MQAPEQMPLAARGHRGPMARSCPACEAPLPVRQVRVLRTRSNRSTWFKFAADRYFCPGCEVELQRQHQSGGIVLLCVAAVLMAIAFIAALSLLPAGPWRGVAPIIAVLAALPLIACYAKRGFTWTVK